MFNNEEKLPLYLKDKNYKSNFNDEKKRIISEKINEKKRNILILIKNFYFDLFNKKNNNIRYFFYLFVFIELLYYYIGKISEYVIIKFSIGIIFFIPLIIVMVENESFFKICSLFEFKMLITIIIIIFFNKNMNFIEIFLFSLILNIFEIIFTKKLYINEEYLGFEIRDRNLLKMNIFQSNFSLLIIGYFCNFIYLYYLNCSNKLNFELFDEIIPFHNLFYFGIFLYLSSKKLLKYLKKVYQSKFYFDYIKYAKIIYFFLIFFPMIIIYISSNNFKSFLYIIFLISSFIIFYKILGIIIYFLLIILYFIIYFSLIYITTTYNNHFQEIIINNLSYVFFSFIISIVFIIIVYYLEFENISKTDTSIYGNIFKVKILYDIWLYINFIYNLYKENPNYYIEYFFEIYKLFLIFFSINYIIIYFAIYLKLNLNITEEDVNWYFEDLNQYFINKKSGDLVIYGFYTPIIEIRFYKLLKKICSNFSENIYNYNKKLKSLKKIEKFIILIIFVLLYIIINNSCLFYIIYVILIQFMQGIFNKICKKIIYINVFIYKNFDSNEDINKNKKLNIKIKKEKIKLISIILYPYCIMFSKIILSQIFIFIFENVIAKIQFFLLGKLEPVENIIYQIINKNNKYDNLNSFDLLITLLFLLPNTLSVLYYHINDEKPNFFFQNYLLTSLFVVFFKTHYIVTITGILNLFIMLNLFAADEEAYTSLPFWFDFIGIQSTNYYN